MRRVKIASLVIAGLVFVLIAIILVVYLFKPKVAGIHIETTPLATVYIDGVDDGRTPYDKKDKKPGEYIIKLVPDSFDIPLAPYETRVNLVAGVQTVIRRDFGETDETSSSEVISFEEIDKNQVSLAVVSVPDSAELIIDANERVFTPHRTTSLLPGVHSLILRAEGYQDKEVKVRTHEGYKLTAVIKMAEDTNYQAEENNQEVTEKVVEEIEKVRILSTPTGFLRVRSEPSTLGSELGTVEPGEEYALLEKDEETGWYKIKFIEGEDEEEKEGWISNQYAEIVENALTTPSPTPESDI